jgi:predicted nucleic acid-binding protein
VTLLYADSSALVRSYFADEPDHLGLRALLFEGGESVVTSEIARLELASAVRAASTGGRLPRWRDLLARMEADLAGDGPIDLIGLRTEVILPMAYRLIVEHRLRALDAIHLAVCLEDCPAVAGGDDIAFVTRDAEQARAARSLGVVVR